MRITYFIEDTQLSGGTRVVLAQADALIARGHRVRVVTKGLPLTWRKSRAEWQYVDGFQQYDASDDDFVVATFWTTVEPAYNLARERTVHLSQGYEGAFTAYQDIKPQIDAAYKLPIPKLIVAEPLAPVLKQFTDDVTWIGQIVEDEFFRTRIPRENEPMRVLLSGPSQADMKGVHEGYGAVAHARWFHQKFDFIRVSPWAPSRDEPLDSVQEFHVGLTTDEMTRLMHSCDVLIAPNHREEGFGLPAAEALASGLATVITSIPTFLSFDAENDYALFAPEDNAVELGEKLIELLTDESLRQRLRNRGREVAEQWRAPLVAERLEKFFDARSARTV
ncbi:MAG TPA: glycosyltransferase family 4 protein [Thermoanaerobaculia bacterium]|nr:glycosyltransferase family 4 protein [Thermoanaerobaculia bacterium]